MKSTQTLCLIRRPNQILLGMKKRGFGAGRWNGFGGKVGADESIEEAARRELLEEVGLTAGELTPAGRLQFSFHDRPDQIEVHFFEVVGFTGEPAESEEMEPRWFDLNKIPFDDMWPDDRHWIPLFLAGQKFHGRFHFGENDSILEQELTTE